MDWKLAWDAGPYVHNFGGEIFSETFI